MPTKVPSAPSKPKIGKSQSSATTTKQISSGLVTPSSERPLPPKKLPKLSAEQWKRKYDKLLILLFKLMHDSKSGFVELGLRSEAGETLRTCVRAERRHEWAKVGECWHLFAVHMHPKQSVGYVVQESLKKFIWRIEGRRYTEGTDRSLKKAQLKIEAYFETISALE